MKQIAVTSTLTRSLQTINSSDKKNLSLYVCGVTPYDDAHIGHGRCYVTFDVLYRLLQASGYTVSYCRNITDIDDKLLNRARVEEGSEFLYSRIAERYTARFQEDMAQLRCLPPTYEPRVTEHIPEIISCIERLIASNHAYVSKGSVYFRVHSYASYGALSGQNLAEICSGSRVEINSDKEDPLDFALWKNEEAGTYWQSPWGHGRPGWHIECSALALRYLGSSIDLHGGGMDLMFPHHENERAQSECITMQPFVRIWMHNAFVRVQTEKMSKSLGNFITLRDAFSRVEPMVLRYYYLTHHYRNPLDFSWTDIEAARKSYRKLVQLLAPAITHISTEVRDLQDSTFSADAIQLMNQLLNFLYDDLNIQGAFGYIFEHASLLKEKIDCAAAVVLLLQSALGLSLEPVRESMVEITPEIQQLLDERQEARAQRNWKRADELRAQLLKLNVAVKDDKR